MNNRRLFIDNVLDNPHSSVSIKKHNKQHSGIWCLENMLGHFDGFPIGDIYNVKHLGLFPSEKKYILSFIHMPIINAPYLSQQATDAIKNDKDCFLVLFSNLEYVIEPKTLTANLSKRDIPLDKVLVVTSNTEAHGQTINQLKYICINFWESHSRLHIKTLPGSSIMLPKDRLSSLDTAKRKFLSLNRNVKPHRIWFYYSILKTEMQKEGHVSFHLPNVDKADYESLVPSHWVTKRIPRDLHADYIKTAKRKMFTRKLDAIDTGHIINYTDTSTQYYHDSVLSYVTESDPFANFITEKTYKAIANLHPFFIVGNPEQHTLLRARGYYTFEDLFETDSITNYEQAFNSLSKLKSKDLAVLKQTIKEKYFDKLLHNQQNFLNRKVSWKAIEDEIVHQFESNS